MNQMMPYMSKAGTLNMLAMERNMKAMQDNVDRMASQQSRLGASLTDQSTSASDKIVDNPVSTASNSKGT